MENYIYNEGYLYNDSFSEKEFKDAVLKHILDDLEAPSYIFDEMELSKIKRINVPLILSIGESKIEYVRMIGFDTIETTTKYKTNSYGNKTHSTSSRTITNWQKDSGTIIGSASSGYFDEKYNIYEDYIAKHQMDKNNFKLLSNDDLKNYPLTDKIIEYLKNDTLDKVFKANITYPGNHVKDETYDGNTNLTNISCTIVSLYQVSVKIRDKAIDFIAASNGKIDIISFGEYPIENFENNLKFNMEISKERKEATKRERMLAKISLLSSFAIFILLLILGLSLNILALTIISIFVLAIGLILGIKYLNDVKRISKPFYKKIYDHNHKVFKEHQRIKEEGYQSFINKNQ